MTEKFPNTSEVGYLRQWTASKKRWKAYNESTYAKNLQV